ncbi:MAG: phosphoribosylformylglycinamidine synthase [Spirochaetaceae bacterium]
MITLYVEGRSTYRREGEQLLRELRESLFLEELRDLRLLQRYDVAPLREEELSETVLSVFADPTTDSCSTAPPKEQGWHWIAVEYLPGQFDQRADSAEQCLQLILDRRPRVRNARVYGFRFGEAGPREVEGAMESISSYLINPVDSRLCAPFGPHRFMEPAAPARESERLEELLEPELSPGEKRKELGLAMSDDDFQMLIGYFREQEHRPPTVAELRVLDTYWSDHCRHTTFATALDGLDNPGGHPAMQRALAAYWELRALLGVGAETPPTLMELATIYAKTLRARGKLRDQDLSEEINAATLRIDVERDDGRSEPWHLLFKNETHNHPTEIEPIGGAETCLGGAIRDPLSGRAFVYQGMRVTGAADPRRPLTETRPGKLPQRLITTRAAEGFSSYGNQIGLATGQVREYYHSGYEAKRLETGAVIGAVPASHVKRRAPEPGDRVLLIGGETGRDGCGGATGSSKAQDGQSLREAAPEVQKGNPPVERALQRLFRRPEFARQVRRCNDFGAGGISVAVGEIAPSIDIDLDAVPLKYHGLRGTEIAISESQERMACVVSAETVERVIGLAAEENLQATPIATVTDTGRVRMAWRGETILDLSRRFIETNGAPRRATVSLPELPDNPLLSLSAPPSGNEDSSLPSPPFAGLLLRSLSALPHADQRGLLERFDSSIGAWSHLAPYGGLTQRTPAQVMASELPLSVYSEEETTRSRTLSLMTHGFDPGIAEASPFHGAYFAVVDSVARLVAAGARRESVRLSLQEYFPRPGDTPERWGLPAAALLGALQAQIALETPAIGGKDSMSGSFEELDVPPTLISFAVATIRENELLTPELKGEHSSVYLLSPKLGGDGTYDSGELRRSYDLLRSLRERGLILAAGSTARGGLFPALTIAAFGNHLSLALREPGEHWWAPYAFASLPGALYLQIPEGALPPESPLLHLVGRAVPASRSEASIRLGEEALGLEEAYTAWSSTLAEVFPVDPGNFDEKPLTSTRGTPPRSPGRAAKTLSRSPSAGIALGSPRVCIPVFPGTNCEFDLSSAFRRAGALVSTPLFRNRRPEEINNSVARLKSRIDASQILMFPGGFSAGDEPDGSGKFIAAVFRNPSLQESVEELLSRGGLILGICNGFQALVRLGLLPGGALVLNRSGRHFSGYLETEVVSNASPWLAAVEPGERYRIPISHGEGRYLADPQLLRTLSDGGQIATQYVEYNPNGSAAGIEGLLSSDGRVFGKMGHNERALGQLYRNLPPTGDMKIFDSGVAYFR